MNLLDELEREKTYADTMKAAAAMWMERAATVERDKQRLVVALVEAAGGEITVPQDVMHGLRRLELVTSYGPADMTVTFKTQSIDRRAEAS